MTGKELAQKQQGKGTVKPQVAGLVGNLEEISKDAKPGDMFIRIPGVLPMACLRTNVKEDPKNPGSTKETMGFFVGVKRVVDGGPAVFSLLTDDGAEIVVNLRGGVNLGV